MYIQIRDNKIERYPITLDEFKKEHTNVSFPQDITEEILNSFDVYSVVMDPPPQFSPITHALKRTGPVLVEGVWHDGYILYELDAETVEKNIIERDAGIQQRIESKVRMIQNARRKWLDDQIDPDGLQLAFLLYTKGTEKGVAMFQWSVNLGLESEKRQNDLRNGLIEWDVSLLDFSMFPKPYTIAELIADAGI